MKVFFITKKTILFFAIILLLFVSAFSILHTPTFLAVSAPNIHVLSEELANKITNLPKGEEKIAYLTFDDGPSPNVTPKILDILKEENVKASFFVIGKYVDSYPEVTKRAYEEGHFIANHGYDHDDKVLYKSDSSFMDEVKKTDLAISNAIGVEGYSSHIFRFPTGYMSSNHKAQKKDCVKLLTQMDYTYIDWNCLNNDSVKKYSKEQLLSNLKKTMKGKDTLVVLMHDTKFVSDSSAALKESIEYIRSQGYTFDNFYSLFQ